MIKAVILDMDGTIVNSDELVLNIYKELTNKFKPNISLESITREDLLAKNYKEILSILYNDDKINYLEEVFKLHNQLHDKYLDLFDGTKEFLKELNKRNIDIHLFTSELKDITIKTLTHLGIVDYFKEIITFDDVKNPKPSSEGLEKIIKKYEYSFEEVLFVGDSIQDALSAKNINVTLVFNNWHMNIEKEKHFNFSVYSFEELLSLIKIFSPLVSLETIEETFKIIQFTDLHLMDNEKDNVIYKIIETMVNKHKPDLIVYTGDQTMSAKSLMLYEKLINLNDSFNIPWTLIFGNHDTDGGVSHDEIVNVVKRSKNIYFNKGPRFLGYSNFYFKLNETTILYFLDSHQDSEYLINGKWTHGYDEVWDEQLEFMKKVKELNNQENSLIFLHIPPYVYKKVEDNDYVDNYNEDVCSPLLDNGFHELSKTLNTKGVFVGHDHYNDFSFKLDDITYAYGRVTGFFEYKDIDFDKGCRIIEVDKKGNLKTFVDTIK